MKVTSVRSVSVNSVNVAKGLSRLDHLDMEKIYVLFTMKSMHCRRDITL